MGIADRLRRLEQVPGSSCPTCGQPGACAYDVIHVDSYKTYQEAYEGEPEFCPACQRKLVYPVYWDPTQAETTLPVVIVKTRPKREEYPGGY